MIHSSLLLLLARMIPVIVPIRAHHAVLVVVVVVNVKHVVNFVIKGTVRRFRVLALLALARIVPIRRRSVLVGSFALLLLMGTGEVRLVPAGVVVAGFRRKIALLRRSSVDCLRFHRSQIIVGNVARRRIVLESIVYASLWLLFLD